MSLEKFPNQPPQEEQEKEKPGRLVESAKLLADSLFRVETEGKENLKDIPKGKRIIFAPTHMSDYDVPITVAKMGESFGNLAVADASTHERFYASPSGYLARRAGGWENFFRVDFTGGRGDGQGIFNPDNYEPMKKTLESGRPMTIAAYYDTSYAGHTWQLSPRGGYGAVYLSQITKDAIIVPVAVDIKSEKPFGMGEAGILQIIKERRPQTTVKIGKPIEPTPIAGIEHLAEILRKRKARIPLTPEDRKEFSRLKKELKKESKKVMDSLAEMLPPEKRNRWGKESPIKPERNVLEKAA